MKAPGTPEPMQPATSTSAPRKLPEMMVPPADTWPLGQRRPGALAGLLTVNRNNPASYPMLACKVPLKAPAPLEAEKVKNMATASEPDPADPEPDTFSWALLEFWAFRPYAVPIGPSPEPARSPTNTKRQSILRLLGEVIIKQRVAFDRASLSEFRFGRVYFRLSSGGLDSLIDRYTIQEATTTGFCIKY